MRVSNSDDYEFLAVTQESKWIFVNRILAKT